MRDEILATDEAGEEAGDLSGEQIPARC